MVSGDCGPGWRKRPSQNVTLETVCRDVDGVRATDTQAGFEEGTRCAGNSGRRRAGSGVQDGDGSAGDRVTVGVDDATTQIGRRFLRVHGSGSGCQQSDRRRAEGEFFL